MDINEAKVIIDKFENKPGKFSSLEKKFLPYKKELSELAQLSIETHIREIIYNIKNNRIGPGICETCGGLTKEVSRVFCSVRCGNAKSSSRTIQSDNSKNKNDSTHSNPIIKRKFEETMILRHGGINPSSIEKFQQKKKETCLRNYGVEHPAQSVEIMSKIVKTKVERFGQNYAKEFRKKSAITHRQTSLNQLIENNPEWIIDSSKEWLGCREEPIHATHLCGYQDDFWMWFGTKTQELRCPKCNGSSLPQKRITDFLDDLGLTFLINDRQFIRPKELDILIDSHKLAIEINGLYYHSELSGGKNSRYHLEKTESVFRNGYQLIHLTDADILYRWPAVKTMLLAKIGLLEKVYARKTEIREISKYDADVFLSNYHMQGTCRASIRYGLFLQNELISVMTFGKSRFDKNIDYELLRFCSIKTVVGGASKLLATFRKFNKGSIVSYADLRWSVGKLYEKIGFNKIHQTSPSYWYFNPRQIENLYHRSLFQKKKISTLENEHLTEWEIMQSLGYDRIWDCGSIKWILDNK